MKKFVMIGAVVLFLLTGANVYATSNPGSPFSSWYKARFEPSKEAIFGWMDSETLAMQDTISTYTTEMVEKITRLLDPTATINSTKDSINNQKESYEMQIKATKEKLNTEDFKTYEEEQKEKINIEIEQDIEEFLKDYVEK